MDDVVAVDGRIEAASDGVLRGWVWRRDGAEEIRLAVTVDGALVASEIAGEERDDLVLGPDEPPGRGFRIDLPDALVETGDRRIGVQVLPESVPLPAEVDYVGTTPDGVWATTTFEVDETAAILAEGGEGPAPAAPRRMALEDVSAGAVAGWMRSRKNPPRQIVLSLDGREVARAPANIRRTDLERHCHGFRIEIPKKLRSGGPHAVEVSVGPDRFPIIAGDLLPTTATAEAEDAPDLRFVQLDEAPGGEPGPPVLLGRDGWLFETRDERPIRWDKPLKPPAVQAFVELVAGWSAQLDELGIPYVLAFLPARERLEREHLPSGVPEPRPGPLSQVLPLVADGTAIDLGPPLRRARRGGRVSWRTDPALSGRGSLVAARALAGAAVDADPRLPGLRGDVTFLEVPGARGRWAGRPKVVPAEEGLAGIDPADAPLSSYGEHAPLPGPEDLSALRVQPGPHLAGLGERAAVLQGAPADGRRARAVLVAAGLPVGLGAWLAEAYARVTIVDDLAPPGTEIELEAPDVVFHVLDESAIRLLV